MTNSKENGDVEERGGRSVHFLCEHVCVSILKIGWKFHILILLIMDKDSNSDEGNQQKYLNILTKVIYFEIYI